MPAIRRIVRSDEALATLVNIYVYSKHEWGIKRAKTYIKAFDIALKTLAKTPGIGHSLPSVPSTYRLYPVGSHLLVYHFDEKYLFVIAVLHTSMDVEKRLAILKRP